MLYTKHLSEPWFTLIKIGSKTCEGRLNQGDFSKMKKGDHIKFTNEDFGFPRSFICIITVIRKYNTFEEYLTKETLVKCLPGLDTITEGVNLYYKYYKKEDEILYKINAVKFKVFKNKKSKKKYI